MEIVIYTLDVIGKILIAMAALMVHHRVLHEHKIDRKVYRSMKVEQGYGILGVVLIVAAYVLRITNL